ncbi:MAG: hypothetical protein Q7V63_08635 [Gammaproteobacteria bacterium]|nr:hypothetical protein [Gammaproteobacteria bacterium]
MFSGETVMPCNKAEFEMLSVFLGRPPTSEEKDDLAKKLAKDQRAIFEMIGEVDPTEQLKFLRESFARYKAQSISEFEEATFEVGLPFEGADAPVIAAPVKAMPPKRISKDDRTDACNWSRAIVKIPAISEMGIFIDWMLLKAPPSIRIPGSPDLRSETSISSHPVKSHDTEAFNPKRNNLITLLNTIQLHLVNYIDKGLVCGGGWGGDDGLTIKKWAVAELGRRYFEVLKKEVVAADDLGDLRIIGYLINAKILELDVFNKKHVEGDGRRFDRAINFCKSKMQVWAASKSFPKNVAVSSVVQPSGSAGTDPMEAVRPHVDGAGEETSPPNVDCDILAASAPHSDYTAPLALRTEVQPATELLAMGGAGVSPPSSPVSGSGAVSAFTGMARTASSVSHVSSVSSANPPGSHEARRLSAASSKSANSYQSVHAILQPPLEGNSATSPKSEVAPAYN